MSTPCALIDSLFSVERGVFGYAFVVRWALIQTSEVLMVNMAYLYVSVPVAGLLWLLFLTEDFYKGFILKGGAAAGTR